jgi:hypothetical protein
MGMIMADMARRMTMTTATRPIVAMTMLKAMVIPGMLSLTATPM